MVPPAPGLLSTTTGWPSALASGSLMARATMSLAPPAAKVTTMRTGFSGQEAWAAPAASRAQAMAVRKVFMRRSPRAVGRAVRKPRARSGAAVGAVAPRAHQQRHVVVAGGVGDAEVELHHVDERRLRQRRATRTEVGRHLEQQPVAAGGHRRGVEQRA